jgi:hypothetical protein
LLPRGQDPVNFVNDLEGVNGLHEIYIETAPHGLPPVLWIIERRQGDRWCGLFGLRRQFPYLLEELVTRHARHRQIADDDVRGYLLKDSERFAAALRSGDVCA